MIDTGDLPPVGASADLFSDGFLVRPLAVNAADRRKLMDDGAFAASTGVMTHQGPAYVVDPTNGTVYLVTQDDIDDWNIAFNEVLQETMFRIDFFEWDPTSNTTRQYNQTAAPISAPLSTTASQSLQIHTPAAAQTAR